MKDAFYSNEYKTVKLQSQKLFKMNTKVGVCENVWYTIFSQFKQKVYCRYNLALNKYLLDDFNYLFTYFEIWMSHNFDIML